MYYAVPDAEAYVLGDLQVFPGEIKQPPDAQQLCGNTLHVPSSLGAKGLQLVTMRVVTT